MKFSFLFLFFFLAKEFSCSTDPLGDLMDMHNKIQQKIDYVLQLDTNSEEFIEMGAGFIHHVELLPSKYTPIEMIEQFSALFDSNVTFVSFFWVNYMTIRLKGIIFVHKGVLNELPMHVEGLVSLISYIKENFFVLNGLRRELFAYLALDFYYLKIRRNILPFLKEKKPEFLQIDREFALLQKSFTRDFRDYTIPEDFIYCILQKDHQNMITNPDEKDHKINFFFHVKYFIRKTTIYKILYWLAYQDTKFIKDFLAISTLKAVDVYADPRVPEYNPPYWIYVKGLHQLCSLFAWKPKSRFLVVKVSQEKIQSYSYTLETFTVDELSALLNFIYQKISK
jgi:hypothetical protein